MYTEERKGSLLKSFILKLILIIIFVLLLIWLVPWPNMDAYIDALNPLKDQIFNANIQEMKNAAITYYTTERLPENVGDVKKMTLQEMLDMKLLIPFVDKNGNSCDVTASYVSLEKKDTEYLMKVNLKCGEEENYILVHLGCYSYCSTDICEAKPGNTEKPTTTPKPTNTSKPTPTTTPTSTPKPTVTPTLKPTPTPTTTTTPTATPTVTPILPKACEIKDGKYYGKNATEVTYEEWKKQCTVEPTPDPVKEYEYKKYTAAYCENWSAWTTKVLKSGETLTLTNTIYKVVEDLGTKKVQIGVLPAVYEKVIIPEQTLEVVDSQTYQVCTGYDYIITGGTVHQVTGDWQYTGRESRGYNAPAPATESTRWVAVGVDFNVCGNDCTNHPYVVWKEQTRSVVSYNNPLSITATCTESKTSTINVYAPTTKLTTKTVLKTPEEPYYANVHYYRDKTCINVVEAKTSYVWSSYNDTSLLNDGYTYTGKTRNK